MNLSCTICRSDYQEDDSVLELPCSHLFHPPCITTWLKLVKYLFTFTVTTGGGGFLSLTLPAFLPSAILFFFYPKKKRGGGSPFLENTFSQTPTVEGVTVRNTAFFLSGN